MDAIVKEGKVQFPLFSFYQTQILVFPFSKIVFCLPNAIPNGHLVHFYSTDSRLSLTILSLTVAQKDKNVVNYIDRNVASAWGVVSLTKMIRLNLS